VLRISLVDFIFLLVDCHRLRCVTLQTRHVLAGYMLEDKIAKSP